jgi:hypothetical protein
LRLFRTGLSTASTLFAAEFILVLRLLVVGTSVGAGTSALA